MCAKLLLHAGSAAIIASMKVKLKGCVTRQYQGVPITSKVYNLANPFTFHIAHNVNNNHKDDDEYHETAFNKIGNEVEGKITVSCHHEITDW